MGLKAKDTGGGEPRELVPAGNYFGRVCGVYDIGNQSGGQFGTKHKIIVTWELHRKKGPARDSAGNVMTISNFYSLSFHEKSGLRQDVESMLGQSFNPGSEFDVESLLGVSCRLTVAHKKRDNGEPIAVIKALAIMDDDDPTPEAASDDVYFEIGTDRSIPDAVPAWVRKWIEASDEWKDRPKATAGWSGRPAPKATVPPSDEETPF